MVLFLNNINLNAVTSATNGIGVNVSNFERKSVFINVSVNTGAVTVNIEASPTGRFDGEQVTLDSKTYTATTGQDVFSYASYFQYMRTTTTVQSNSTVTTIFVGRE